MLSRGPELVLCLPYTGSIKILTFLFPHSYIGSWKDNKRHGFGTLTFVNGSKYEGEFENHKVKNR